MTLASSKAGWELYDVEADRIEIRNAAGVHPDVVRRLSDEYDRWASPCGVIAREALRPGNHH